MKLGHDFGTTPFGLQAVEDAHRRDTGCVCDPQFVALDVHDLRCPVHGLTAFLNANLAPTETRA